MNETQNTKTKTFDDKGENAVIITCISAIVICCAVDGVKRLRHKRAVKKIDRALTIA